VVAVAVQNTFRIEMHQNDVFLFFLKIIFKISILKPFENIKKKLAKKKNRVPKRTMSTHVLPRASL
jgi:hypothetical protein